MVKEPPADRKYSREHEWAKDNGDGTATVGVTDHAQEMLTDVVFVELPAVGKIVAAGETVAVVESVKSVAEVYAPVGGTVREVNRALEEHPELINQDAYGEGWILRLEMHDPGELEQLLDAVGYMAFLGAEGGTHS